MYFCTEEMRAFYLCLFMWAIHAFNTLMLMSLIRGITEVDKHFSRCLSESMTFTSYFIFLNQVLYHLQPNYISKASQKDPKLGLKTLGIGKVIIIFLYLENHFTVVCTNLIHSNCNDVFVSAVA